MKNKLILYIIFFFQAALHGQELSSEMLEKKLVGYWKNKYADQDEILVINEDKTFQYFKNNVKSDYGKLEITFQHMFRLNFTFCTGDVFTRFDTWNNYIRKLPDDMLQFGDSPVDGGDCFFQRMSSKEIDNFYGKKLLSRAFRRKSDKLLLKHLKEWQLMENPGLCPPDETDQYHQEACSFFSVYFSNLLKDVQEPTYAIVGVGLKRIQIVNFSLPTTSELDSFVNIASGYSDYRAYIGDEKMYNNIVMENLWGRYFEKLLGNKDIVYDSLKNFTPLIRGNNHVTYLDGYSRRSEVIDKCMRKHGKKYKKWYFGTMHHSKAEGFQYYVTDTPQVTQLIFNTQLNLAIVNYTYDYCWVRDLYEKKDGKWQFHSTIMDMCE